MRVPISRSAVALFITVTALSLGTPGAMAANVDPQGEAELHPTSSVPVNNSTAQTAGKVGASPTAPSNSGSVPPASSTAPQATVPTAASGGAQTSPSHPVAPPPAATKFTGTRCTKSHHQTVCRSFRRGIESRICVRRGHGHNKCHSVNSTHRDSARAASVTDQGFISPPAAVGKIFRESPGQAAEGDCSGTLIAANLIITAGHCLYSTDQAENGFTGYMIEHKTLWFAADESFGSDGGSDINSSNAPYGYVRIVRSWVPQCWADGDGACDYGLAEVQPYSDGSYVGSLTGTFPLVWDYSLNTSERFMLEGYPEANAFRSAQNHYGDEAYDCDTSLEKSETAADDPQDQSLLGSGLYLISDGCKMTGGASGGPVFTQLTNGYWYVAGVNNIGATANTMGTVSPDQEFMAWNYWTSDFGSFLCGVVPSICQ